MIQGLFLDPRTWKIDFLSSEFWKPEKYGVHIDLHPNAFNIPKLGIDKKYKFVLATEVWEIPIQKTLEYLQNKGLKIFLAPREPIKTNVLKHMFFNCEKFLYNGTCYFNPDVVLAPNKVYANFWEKKSKCVITGYPRFDYLYNGGQNINKEKIRKKYGLTDKKIIFFPSYPPIHNKVGGGLFDIHKGRETTLRALESFVKVNKDYQVVVKIHPMSFKCFRKGTGKGNEVSGTLLKYYNNPTEYMKVIGDERMSGNISKDILLVSDIVVGFSSTMLLEALALNKDVVHMLFGNTQDVNFNAYKDFMPTVHTESELHNFINNPYKMKESKALLEDYLFKTDDKCCERMCSTIKQEMQYV